MSRFATPEEDSAYFISKMREDYPENVMFAKANIFEPIKIERLENENSWDYVLRVIEILNKL